MKNPGVTLSSIFYHIMILAGLNGRFWAAADRCTV